jgi:hypothetical protein
MRDCMIHAVLADFGSAVVWAQIPFLAIFLIDAATIWCPRHHITKKTGFAVHLPLLVIPLWLGYESLIPPGDWIRIDWVALLIANIFAGRRYLENLRKVYGHNPPGPANR